MHEEHQNSSDPRENREIIEQVIQLAEDWEAYRKDKESDLMNEREEYPLFRRLHDYVHSLSKEQLDAVYCAYELGGGLDGYAPPKLIDSDVEDDDEDCAIKRLKTCKNGSTGS